VLTRLPHMTNHQVPEVTPSSLGQNPPAVETTSGVIGVRAYLSYVSVKPSEALSRGTSCTAYAPMNDRSQLPPERRRTPLDNHGEYCQVTSAFPTAKSAKLLMGDPFTVAYYDNLEGSVQSWSFHNSL
jgi:hypothetical protein